MPSVLPSCVLRVRRLSGTATALRDVFTVGTGNVALMVLVAIEIKVDAVVVNRSAKLAHVELFTVAIKSKCPLPSGENRMMSD